VRARRGLYAPIDRPPVVAVTEGDGFEEDEGLLRFFHMVLLEPYWNIDEVV
jgi:hypothetical protein